MILIVGAWCALTSNVGATFEKSPAPLDTQYLIQTWDTEDGLPENSVTSMVQDPRGYLWFGTFGGLVRFDGVNFAVFDRFNTPNLPDDGIVNLHLDRAGRLWVSTVGGLALRDGSRWQALPTWSGNLIRTFSERSDGDLLLTTFDGHLLEWHGQSLRQLPLPPGTPGKGYFGYADEQGKWWVIRDDFAGYFDGQKWVRAADGANCCCTSRDRGMWLCAGTTLRKWQEGREVAKVQLSEPVGGIWQMSQDTEGYVWIATSDNGICRVSPSGLVRRWDVRNGLAAGAARFVFEDTEHDLWIGTSGGGLQRFKARRFLSIGNNEGLPNQAVHSVWPVPDGGALIGTYGSGVFLARDGTIEKLPGWTGSANVQSVLVDRAGRTWVGTYHDGVWLFEGGKGRNISSAETGGNNAIGLFEDTRGRIWIEGGTGIAVYEGGKFRTVQTHPGDPGEAFKFAQDAAGTVWAANRKGVFRLEPDRLVELTDGGRAIRDVIAVYGDGAGNLWMAADHGDLLCYRDGKFTRIDTRSGLPVGRIRSMIEDLQGFLWMTSNVGLVRVRRESLGEYAAGRRSPLNFNVFTRDDGLPGTDFYNETQPVSARGLDGRLWFATTKGVASVDPAALRIDMTPPPLEVQALVYQGPAGRAAGKGVSRGVEEVRLEAPFPQKPSIPAGSRLLEIDFAAISMSAPAKVRYQVKLEPLDGDWQDAGGQRLVVYRDPEPGDYVFRVRAADEDGVWSEKDATLAFTVRPHFWQTAWFRFGSGMVLLGTGAAIAGSFLRARHRRELEVRRERDELAHLSRVAMLGELSGSLAHELNQPLAAILSNAQAAQRFMARDRVELGEVKEILTDIIDADKRAGEIIQRLRLMLKKGEVNRQPLDMNDLVMEVLRLVRTDLANHDVELETDLGPNLPMVLGDRVQLQQVLLNLIMNASESVAVNANGDRRITVRTRCDDGACVRTSVIDRGPGIPPDRIDEVFEPFFTTKSHGMGLGLAVCRSIVAAHRGKLSAANNSDRGARFDMTLYPAGESA